MEYFQSPTANSAPVGNAEAIVDIQGINTLRRLCRGLKPMNGVHVFYPFIFAMSREKETFLSKNRVPVKKSQFQRSGRRRTKTKCETGRQGKARRASTCGNEEGNGPGMKRHLPVGVRKVMDQG